jgi:F0F1-type ATP synthase assembly protein I
LQPLKKEYNKYLKYSSLGFQMLVIIAGLSLLGDYLDERLAFETPWLTLVFSLLGVTASMYLLIKQLNS